MKKPIDPVKQFRDWMRNTLRRTFFRFWERTKTIQAARVTRGIYKCANCSALSKIKGMYIDHISPVVDPRVGFMGWDTYIARLFCSADNLQLLCKLCHSHKTDKERLERKKFKTGIYSPNRNKKISMAKLGKPNMKLRRAIICTHAALQISRVFDSTKTASEILCIGRKRITDVLIRRRYNASGWLFTYKEDYERRKK